MIYKIGKNWTKISNFWTDSWKKWKPQPHFCNGISKTKLAVPPSTFSCFASEFTVHRSPSTKFIKDKPMGKYTKQSANQNIIESTTTSETYPPHRKGWFQSPKSSFKTPQNPFKILQKASKPLIRATFSIEIDHEFCIVDKWKQQPYIAITNNTLNIYNDEKGANN